MGVTPLMWKSLDNFGNRWNPLVTTPVQWNPAKGIFIYNGVSRKLIPWAVAHYFIILPLLLVYSAFLLAPLAGLGMLPFTDYVVNFFYLVCTSSCLFTETLSLLSGKTLVLSVNSLLFLYKKEKLAKGKFVLKLNICLYFSAVLLTGHVTKETRDYLGICLNLCVNLFTVYPYIFWVFILYSDLDPYIMVYKYWIPWQLRMNAGFNLFFHCARSLQLISLLMLCQTLCKGVVMLTIATHTFLSCIAYSKRSVADIGNLRKGPAIMLRHKTLEIIFKMGDFAIKIGVLVVMSALFWLSVVTSFVSIKLRGIIGMPLYLFFPSAAILIFSRSCCQW